MNCQEVMELMQRQLDDDLDESEKEVLTNHTRQCPDCAAMFERLQLLSAELTSLPKVMPSYSLVDAIMPELERMELYGKSAALAEPIASIDTSHAVPRRAKRQRRWPSIRIMSGVIAAGIVAGLFLVTYQPGSLPDIGSLAKSSSNDSSSNAAETANQAPEGMSFSASDARVGAPNPEVSTEGFNREDVTLNNKLESDASDGKTDEGTGSMPSSPEQGQLDGKNIAGGSDFGVAQDGKSLVPQENELGGTADLFSFPSPDGKYNAKVEAFTIKLYALNDNSLVYTTPRKNGQLVNLSWADDSSVLAYEVHVEQGAIEKYVIDTASLTEQKAAH